MSGPKVVRVLTREELLERCQGHLARVDAAITEWVKVLKRNEVLTAEAHEEITRSRARLATDAASAQPDRVQAEAERLMAWLQYDVERRLDAKIAAEAVASRARKNLSATAQSLIAEFSKRSTPLPDTLRKNLEGAAGDSQALERAVAQAFLLLTQAEAASATSEKQRELAARLGGGEGRQTLADWLDHHGLGEDREEDPRFLQAERLIAQMKALFGGQAVASLAHRLETLRQESDRSRKGLLLDALCLDVVARMRLEREAEALRLAVAELRATAAAAHAPASTLTVLEPIEAQIAEGKFDTARSGLEAAKAELQRHSEARAALARREAVLKGLRQLGYEVKEGMATAWTRDGRLVVRDPAHQGFGIELGGRGDAGKLQMRAVAVGESTSPRIDGTTETRWCGDFSRLQEFMAASGVELVIEKATPAGVQPLKQVPDVWRDEDERDEPRQMTLD